MVYTVLCMYVGCIMYADDLVLISASVNMFQRMLDKCSQIAASISMQFNAKKSNIMRFGPKYRHQDICLTLGGLKIQVVSTARYLGVFLVAARRFKVSFDEAKRKFFRSINGILAKCKSRMNELTMLHLINMYCKPFLTYAVECMPLLKSDLCSLQSAYNLVYYKLFKNV